jgi:hypothetical protein
VAEILSSYKEWYNDKDEETIGRVSIISFIETC